MKLLKKLHWLWTKFRGRKYFIKYTNELKEDEILVKGHRIYMSKGVRKWLY
jgi:hypothetical protein